MDNIKEENEIQKKIAETSKKQLSLKKRKRIIVLTVLIVLLVIVSTILGLTVFNNDWKHASNNYKIAFEIATIKNEEMSTLISNSENLVILKEKALDETLRTALETAISEAKAAKKELPKKPLLTAEINKKTLELNNINYEKEIQNLKLKYDDLEKSINQYKLVDNPSEAYIITSLKKIPSIVDISAATEENDPNGQLNKQGGYTAHVYFTSKFVNQSDVYGDTVIEKGTDAGGSIEVYTTVEDAREREEYLAGFDGGVLASGSHKVIGTILIRTSNELTATRQKELEENLIAALIGEEIKEEAPIVEKEEEKKEETTPSKVSTPEKPKYYSVVGTYSGPEGTIQFYQDGTFSMGEITGTWVQNGNNVYCRLYDSFGDEWTPQSIIVTKDGLSNWWGKYYTKIS